VFSFQQTLDGLNASEVPNLDKAKLNVMEFVTEILALLKGDEGRGDIEDDEPLAVEGAA
jgi:hypothetical protein